MSTSIDISLAAGLRAHGFTGRLVEPADPAYDATRACWNGDLDRRPAAIALAADADDVAAAVRAATAAAVPLTIRGGGHSSAGRSVRDGALCIDMRALRRVDVDPDRATVRVGAGALLGELDAACQEHGLAVPAGQISHTGVGGLTLGGGVGWLMRHHGLTIDSLLGADVVLADGRSARADADHHPELFWALRGGGGDFAAVTAFEFRAHRVGPVLAGPMVYPWERAAEAFAAARGLMAGAPDELTAFAVVMTAPAHPPFPAELQGRPAVVVAVAWSGEPAAGERALARLRRDCPPLLDLVAPMPYTALQTMLDETAPPGWRYHDRMHYLDEVDDRFVAALLDAYERVPAPQTHVICGWTGGAVGRVAPGATAFGHRDAGAFAWIIGCSGDGPLGPVRDWVRRLWDDTAPLARGGVYVNALHAERPVREAYEEAIWQRLVAAKRAYDPAGVFRANGIG